MIVADNIITSNANENITGVIPNTIDAMQFRARIPDKMALKESSEVNPNMIFITDGSTDSVGDKADGVKVPHVIGKNIIEAVNAAGAVANATNATNVVLTSTANDDGSTTIKAGAGSAKVENCTNANKIQVSVEGDKSYYPIYVSSTVPRDLTGRIVFITEE